MKKLSEEKNEVIEILNFMSENHFVGTYVYNDDGIIWNISKDVIVEVILGGHGGDDCVIYSIIINNKKIYISSEDFVTRDNKVLINYLKGINDSENYIVTWKSLFGFRTKLILNINDYDISKYINNKKYRIYKFGR